tara:strand:+ start:1937 stop:2200 length:264 start_codon:yes stop_codon:yes gene_type:complete
MRQKSRPEGSAKKEYLIFDVLVGEAFEAEGQARTSCTPVATVFRDTATGKLSGKIKEGLAPTGRFIIRARSQKANGQAEEALSLTCD